MQISQISEEQIKQNEFIAVRNGSEVECLVSFDAQGDDVPYSVCESFESGRPRMEFFASLDDAKSFVHSLGWGHDEFNVL